MFWGKWELAWGKEKKLLPVSWLVKLMAKSGKDERKDTNRAAGRGLEPAQKHGHKINCVYVVGFCGDAGCVLICIKHFPEVFLAGCGIHHDWHRWKAGERRPWTVYKNATSLGGSKQSEQLLTIERNLSCLPWMIGLTDALNLCGFRKFKPLKQVSNLE